MHHHPFAYKQVTTIDLDVLAAKKVCAPAPAPRTHLPHVHPPPYSSTTPQVEKGTVSLRALAVINVVAACALGSFACEV